MAGARPAACMRRPASFASATPSSLRGTSCQPVKRFSRFHVLWPCRSSTRIPTWLAMVIYRRGHIDDLGELLGVQARAADQAAVTQRQLDVRLDVARVDAASIKDAHLP